MGCPRHEATGTKYVLGIARWPLVLREVPGGYGGSCLVLSCIVLSCIVSSCIVLCCFVSYCIALCCIIVLMYYAMCSRMTNRASCCRKPHLRKGTTSSSVRYDSPCADDHLLPIAQRTHKLGQTLDAAARISDDGWPDQSPHVSSAELSAAYSLAASFSGLRQYVLYCIVLYCVLFLC